MNEEIEKLRRDRSDITRHSCRSLAYIGTRASLRVRASSNLGTPADIGNAVALFCAKEAGWITGQVIAADGGMGLMDAAVPLPIAQRELQAV